MIETEEGRQQLKQHLQRERSAKLILSFKNSLKDYSCSVCGFEFEKAYGQLGREFIEAHHIKLLSEMEPGEKTKLSDLAAVCSNCHRMLHRKTPIITIDELKERLAIAYMQRHEA